MFSTWLQGEKQLAGIIATGEKSTNGISRVEGKKGGGLLHWLRLELGTGSWVRLLAGPLRVACIDSEFIRHAKLTFNTETWRFVCKLIGPSMPLSAAVTSLASLFMGLHPLHTHTHVRPQQCSWHPLTIWNWFGTSFCGRRCQLPDATVSVSSCIGNMRDPKVSFNLLCGEFLFRHWRRAANQNQKGNWQFNCRAGDGAGGEEGCTMQRPITYICRCSMSSCPAAWTPLFPHFLTAFLPSFQHLHVYFFESTLSFFLTLRQLWLMDWLADQTSDQPNWPVDHWTNWTDWQNADRLTPALAVSSCQSYPVPFYMSFRLPSAFVRSIWVKLSLMDFHARTLQITVTSQVTQWSEDLHLQLQLSND